MNKRQQIILEEIDSGNGNQFTVKETLQAHIVNNREDHQIIFKKMDLFISKKTAINLLVFLLTCIGALTSFIVYYVLPRLGGL